MFMHWTPLTAEDPRGSYYRRTQKEAGFLPPYGTGIGEDGVNNPENFVSAQKRMNPHLFSIALFYSQYPPYTHTQAQDD